MGFEYRVIELESAFSDRADKEQATLNKLGEGGWELVAVRGNRFYLKRSYREPRHDPSVD